MVYENPGQHRPCARRFIDELVARVRRAPGGIVMRFDSGFWSNDTIASLERLDVRYTMAMRTSIPAIAAAIATTPTPGSTSATPPTAGRRWPPVTTRSAASSCAAPASLAARPSCGRLAPFRLPHHLAAIEAQCAAVGDGS